MGKYDELIGSVEMKVSVTEVLDEQAAKKVDKQVREHKKKLEEPIKPKLDLSEVNKQYDALEKRHKEFESEKKRLESKLANETSKNNLEDAKKTFKELERVEEQIDKNQKAQKKLRSDAIAHQKELQAQRGKNRKKSEEEKNADDFIKRTATPRPKKLKASDSGDVEAAKAETQANKELEQSIENVEKARRKSRTSKPKKSEAAEVKEEAKANEELADAIVKVDKAKNKAKARAINNNQNSDLKKQIDDYLTRREKNNLAHKAKQEFFTDGGLNASDAYTKKEAKQGMLADMEQIRKKKEEISQIDQNDILLYRKKNEELIKLQGAILGTYQRFKYGLDGSDKFLGKELLDFVRQTDEELTHLSKSSVPDFQSKLADDLSNTFNVNKLKVLNVLEEVEQKGLSASVVVEKLTDANKELSESYEQVGNAIERTAEEQKKLDELNRLAGNQKDWLKYLDGALDKSKFESSGKRDATNKLKSATNYLVTQRKESYQNAHSEYAKEMAEVIWMHAYQEAEKQGVAQSVLDKYNTDAKNNYESNLKTLQEARNYRQERLEDTQKQIEENEKLANSYNKVGEAAQAAVNAQEQANNETQAASNDGLAKVVEKFVDIRNRQKMHGDDYWDLEHYLMEALNEIRSFIPEGTDANLSVYNDLGYKLNRREKKKDTNFSAEEILQFVKQKISEAEAELAEKAQHVLDVDNVEKQADKNKELAESYEQVGKAAQAAGEKEQKRSKPLNMESAIKRYNKLMKEVAGGAEDILIGHPNTENWNIRDLVSEAQLWLDQYYTDDNTFGRMRDSDDANDRKLWKSETGKLQRFIKAYEPFIDGLNTTFDHGSKYDNVISQTTNGIEAQTEALRENTNAAKENREEKEKSSQSLSSQIFDALKQIRELENQLRDNDYSDADPTTKFNKQAEIRAAISEIERKQFPYISKAFRDESFNPQDAFVDWTTTDEQLHKMAESIALYATKSKEELGELKLIKIDTSGVESLNGELKNIVDNAGNAIDVYRGLANEAQSSGISTIGHNTGATWFSTQKDVANGYTRGTDNLYRANLQARRLFEIDANNSGWSNITFLGDGSDEMSKKITELYNKKKELKEESRRLAEANQMESQSYKEVNAALRRVTADYEYYSKKIDNPYGTNDTNWYARYAQENGYDAFRIKNVYDTLQGGGLSDVIGVFSEEQIINVEKVVEQGKSIGQSVLELEKITGKSLISVLNDYDSLDDGIKEKVNSILKSIGLMNDQLEFTFSRSQGGNAKAVLGQDFVILQKSLEANEDYAESLINKLKEAQELGVNIAPIMERVFSDMSEESYGFREGYEIQQRATGSNVHETQKDLINLNGALQENQVLLGASTESLQKFVADYIKLDEVGLKIDPSKASNFLYDVEKGFSFIDLGLKNVNDQAKTTKQFFREISVVLANTPTFNALGQDENLGFSSGQIVAKIADAFEAMGIATREEIDSWAKEFYDGFGNIFNGYTGRITEATQWIDELRDTANALGEEFKDSQQYKDFFAAIEDGSISATDAAQKLEQAFEEFSLSKIGDASNDVEKVEKQVSAVTLSVQELSDIFNKANLGEFFKSFNISDSDIPQFQKMFAELISLYKAFDNGANVMDEINDKTVEIINSVIRLGSVAQDVYKDPALTEFAEHMRGGKNKSPIMLQYDDSDIAEFGDDWKAIKKRFGKNLTSISSGKGIAADTIYQEVQSLWPHLFQDDVVNKSDQLKAILDVFGKAKDQYMSKNKTLQTLSESDKNAIQSYVVDIIDKMLAPSEQVSKESEKIWTTPRQGGSLKGLNLPTQFVGEDGQSVVQMFAKIKGEIEEITGSPVKIDFMSQVNDNGELEAIGATLEYINNESGVTIKQFYDVARGEDEVLTATQTAERATIKATKAQKEFNAVLKKELALEQINTLKKQMGEFPVDLTKAYEAANKIVDKDSFDEFNLQLKIAQESLRGMKAEMKGQNTLDPIVAAEKRLKSLSSELDSLKNKFIFTSGAGVDTKWIDGKTKSIMDLYDKFNKETDADKKTGYYKQIIEELDKADNGMTNLNELIRIQNKLFKDRKALSKMDKDTQSYKILEESVNLQGKELSNLIRNSEHRETIMQRAIQFEKELAAASQDRIDKQNQKFDSKYSGTTLLASGEWDGLTDQKEAMKKFAESSLDGELAIKGFNKAGTEMYVTLLDSEGALNEVTVALDKSSKKIKAFETGSNGIADAFKQLGSGAMSYVKQLAGMYLGMHDFIRYAQQGIQIVRDIDLAMTELRKVTDETEATYAKFLDTASKSAGAIGSTVKDFTTVTSDFARLGYSIEEASEMAKTALIYENVGDGFNSVEEASESIISTMKAFKIEAGDTVGIVDRFNAVGNNFAITSKGIGDALQRSASALVEGGNSINEAIGLVTAANSVIQNPEQVGTALKTLSLRLRSTKIELEEMGEDAEGAATSTAKLRAQLLGLTGGKVDIMLDETTFKNTTQILREMAAVWGEMDDISKAGALELMGGKRQANILSSVITNFKTVEDVIETAANSAGSALEENQKYIESIQGHIDVLTNSWQTMWNNAVSSDVIKFWIDFANILVKIVDNVGLLQVAFGALAGTIVFKSFGDSENIGIFATLLKKIPVVNTLLSAFNSKLITIGLTEKAAASATGLFGSALTGLAGLGLAVVIPMLINLGAEAIKTTKEIKESAKEAVDSYNSVQQQLENSDKTIKEISADYQKLSLGVDEFGNNISLTTSEYERYNEIVNQIADMFPDMVRGYTDEGNAIIKNKGSVEALTEAYKALQTEANNAIITKASDIMKDYKNTTEGSFWQWDTSTPTSIAAAKELEKILQEQDTYDFSAFTSDYQSAATQMIYGSLLPSAGISRKSSETNDEYVKRAVKEFPGVVQSIINTWESTVNSAVSNVKPLVQAYLDSSVGYAGLTNEQKSVINSMASEFDEEFFNQFDGDASKMQQAIEKMILNIQSSGIDDEYNLVLSARTQLNNNKVTVGEYQDTVHSFIEELERLQSEGLLDENDVRYIKMSIGLDLDDDASVDNLIAHAQKLFNANSPELKELQEQVLSLNYADLQVINSDAFNVDAGTLNSWEQLIDAIERAKIAATQDFTVSNFSDYADDITSVTDNISKLQGAYDSLMSGDFTYEDFLEIVQLFPELAEGVDTSSDSFEGLAKNLRKAIKNAPDDLVDELKDLRAQLVKAGKSTSAIDQLIDSMENLSSDKVDELAEKYVTLADAIDEANQAQGDIAKAMEENPNANYENTSEAVQKMRDMYANGAFGSESEIWDIFEALTGQTYDFSKSLTENRDVLKDWINTYSDFYLRNEGDRDDGEYAHGPIENFLNFMEGKVKEAKEKGEEWAEATTWTYENGTVNIDYDNQYLEEIAKAAGLTEAAFHDLMMQVAQFWAMEWEDGDDIVHYMNETLKLAEESGKNADEILKELAGAMDYFNQGDVDLTNRPEVPFNTENFESWAQYYREITNEVGKYSDEYRKWAEEELRAIESGEYTATVYSNTYYKSQFKELGEGEEDAAIVVTPILPDGTVLSPSELQGYASKLLSGEEIDVEGITLGIFEGEDFAEDAQKFAVGLHEAQEIYYDALERFSAENILSQIDENGIAALDQIEEIKSSVTKGASGEIFVDTVSLTQALTEAQYTEEAIVEVINKLNELDNVTLYDEDSDPFGLYKATSGAESLVVALEKAGIAVDKIENEDGNTVYDIDVREMSEVLASRGWTTNDIINYINSVTGHYNDGSVFAGMDLTVDSTDIDKALGKIEQLPEDAKTDYTIDINPTFTAINDEWDKLTKDKKVDYIVNKKTVYSWGWDFANGTANARGTAFAGGNWGAPNTETALVGELGPEMVVRGNRWFTVGDNGAEFTDIKKGDIIFNHKQTEELLSNGHISGRGKAYASGTAYSTSSGSQNWSTNPTDIGYKGDLNDTLGGIKDEAGELIDFIEIKLEEIEADISKSTAALENYVDDTTQERAKSKQYDNLILGEDKKQQVNAYAADYYSKKAEELWKKIDKKYQDEAKYGALAVKDFVSENDKKQADAIQEYRDMVAKADEAKVAELEAIARIEEIRLEQFNDLADDYDNVISLIEAESGLIQAQMDLQEAKGERLSPEYYNALIENTYETIDDLESKKARMQRDLADAVNSGDVKKGSDAWYEMVNAISDVDEEIIQCKIDIEEFQDAINDLKWDALDKLLSRLDAIDSELSHLFDRFTDTDEVVDEDGNWTDSSIAAMGVAAQQMETAQAKAQQLGAAIADLNANWQEMGYSYDEYQELLADLTEQQWEAIESYEDAKDAIIDLHKARVEAIKEGIKKEIDAYKELIETKKEALDADKDARDFEKSVADKQKEIDDLDRQIAALEGDTSASAVAKRRELEAQRAEAAADLDDLYYDRSIENQKDALDQEAENFEDAKNEEIEALDESLKDAEKLITDSMNLVKENADTVLQEINRISAQYGIQISNEIVTPWQNGSNAVSGFVNNFTKSTSAFTAQIDIIINKYKELEEQAKLAAQAMLGALTGGQNQENPNGNNNSDNDDNSGGSSSGGSGVVYPVGPGAAGGVTNSDGSWSPYPGGPVYRNGEQADSNPSVSSSSTAGSVSDVTQVLNRGDKGDDVKALQQALNNQGYNLDVDGSFGPATEAAVKQYQADNGLKSDGLVGPATKDLFESKGYAKGTLGVPKSDWAWIDEIGEELVLHAGSNGKLSYLTKGSSVIPADLTSKLMDLVVDPTQTLENSRPIISAPNITNNEINISMDIAEIVHIDTVTNDTLPDLTKTIEKQMDKYMKQLNGQIRKYVR